MAAARVSAVEHDAQVVADAVEVAAALAGVGVTSLQ